MSDRIDRNAVTMTPEDDFESHRRHLLAVAYRFLSSVSDAEDIVQETYLRWRAAEPGDIRDMRAYLTRIAARLCLDHLKSARVRREHYVGTWLPEPLVEPSEPGPDDESARADDVSFALLLALERLSPLERAAFVLHDAFGQSFDEIAATLDRSAAACRQLAARARRNLRANRPRFTVTPAQAERMTQAFLRAVNAGDVAALTELLTTDAVLRTDSGGKVRASRRDIIGPDRIARMFVSLARKYGPARKTMPARINGLPGLVMKDPFGITQTLAFDLRDGGIATLYLVRNPEKLRHIHAS